MIAKSTGGFTKHYYVLYKIYARNKMFLMLDLRKIRVFNITNTCSALTLLRILLGVYEWYDKCSEVIHYHVNREIYLLQYSVVHSIESHTMLRWTMPPQSSRLKYEPCRASNPTIT
jgi:hypothetical protein